MEMSKFDPMLSEELAVAISTQASSLFRRYRRFVETDDIRQELWLAVAKNRKAFTDFIDRDPGDKDAVRQGWAAAYKTLWRHGDRYCRREKAVRSGYRPEDEAFYDRHRIGVVLEMMHNGTSFTNQYDDSRPKGKTKPGSGYSLETEFADVESAMKALSGLEKAAMMTYYVDGKTEAEVADILGGDLNRQKVARILDRATKKMINALGGESPYRAS